LSIRFQERIISAGFIDRRLFTMLLFCQKDSKAESAVKSCKIRSHNSWMNWKRMQLLWDANENPLQSITCVWSLLMFRASNQWRLEVVKSSLERLFLSTHLLLWPSILKFRRHLGICEVSLVILYKNTELLSWNYGVFCHSYIYKKRKLTPKHQWRFFMFIRNKSKSTLSNFP